MHNFAIDWQQTDNITDIAIDRHGGMLAVGEKGIYEVDPATAKLTFLSKPDVVLNGLTFVPSPDGTSPERLIGSGMDGQMLEIDATTGVSKKIGDLGNGLKLSGDLVSVLGLGIFATVIADGPSDLLARLDATTFEATIVGDTGIDKLWGVGYWNNRVFGFTGDKEFVLIDPATAATEGLFLGSVGFWGAGVSTLAPVIE